MNFFNKLISRIAGYSLMGAVFTIALVMNGATPTAADPLVRGIQGAIGGAIIGGVVGGRKGVGTGAVIGGTVGVIGGAIEDAERRKRRRVYKRRAPRYATSGLVYQTQKSLRKLDYAPGPVDGVFGGKTSAAISAYQTDNGLLVTGRPSNALLSHMRAVAGS